MKSLLKRVAVGIVGGLVTVIGVIALVAPGPGWLIIFAGLGILATEFAWAAYVLEHAKRNVSKAADRVRLKKEHRDILLAIIFGSLILILLIWYAYLR
jgi:uncharacterized protein (TIGR02611 family)